MQREVKHGLVLELKLHNLLRRAVYFKLHNAVVAADAVAKMNDVVALAEFGKIEQVVNRRTVREHAPARFQINLCAPAEEILCAHKRRALGFF